MSERLKIAICYSGQTRHFNKDPRYTQNFYEILDLFNEYDYDLFGHTWADHEDPHSEVLDKLTEYRSDDQKIIWDAITDLRPTPNKYFPIWTQFFQTQPEWYDKPEYMDMLKGKSDKNFIDFIKNESSNPLGRFSVGTPRTSDGSLLFLQHMISKMESKGSRIGIVFNGSPLFTGDSGSGESEIRKRCSP